MANEMLRELAPLLAEDGIDVENIDAPDIETLQRAMNRTAEQHNTARFTPVADTCGLAAAALRLVVEALAKDDSALASAILDQVQPQSPDNSAPTVSGLHRHHPWAARRLAGWPRPDHARSACRPRPASKGHWLGERAARDILALAGKARAFRSLGQLIARQDG